MAFPIKPVIDNFTGDESPISESGAWAFDSRLETVAARKFGGQLDSTTGTDFYAAVYQTLFGPQCEAYITLATLDPGNAPYIIRIKLHEGTSSYNDYHLFITSAVPSVWQLYSTASAVDTPLGSTVSQTFSTGDSIGLAYDSGNLIAYYKAAAGSWTALKTVADSTYTGATGKTSIESFGQVAKNDNFGGGTINAFTPISVGGAALTDDWATG